MGAVALREHLLRNARGVSSLPTMLIYASEESGTEIVRGFAQGRGWALRELPDAKVDDVRGVLKEARQLHKPTVFLFSSADKLNTQTQNALLKFTEEPNRLATVILVASSAQNILPTIRSRCVWYNVLTGDVENPDLYPLAEKVLDNIGRISAANTFAILKSVGVEKHTLLLPTLIKALSTRLSALVQGSSKSNKSRLVRQLLVMYEWKDYIDNRPNINVERALEQMLLELREVSHGG